MCDDMYLTFNDPISIPCHYYDGECFNWWECKNCKYKQEALKQENKEEEKE